MPKVHACHNTWVLCCCHLRRVILLAYFFARIARRASAGMGTQKKGDPAFLGETLEYLDVKDVAKPETLKGKVVVVEFWATWCAPCKREIPHLNEVYEKYKDLKHFELVSITGQDDREQLAKFIEENKIKYPVAIDTEGKFSTHYPHK